jgi:hypothetical protein
MSSPSPAPEISNSCGAGAGPLAWATNFKRSGEDREGEGFGLLFFEGLTERDPPRSVGVVWASVAKVYSPRREEVRDLLWAPVGSGALDQSRRAGDVRAGG